MKEVYISFLNDQFTQKTDSQNGYTAVLFKAIRDFPLPSRCIDEVVGSRANFQGWRYDVHFLQRHTIIVMHFENGKGAW